MGKLRYTTIIFISIFIIYSCGKNREEEYKPRTDTNNWIIEKMNEVYLWNETMKTSGNLNAVPEIFFPTILTSSGNGGRSDNYSFIDTEGNTNRLTQTSESYGFEYFTENVEGKAISARVLIVYKNSPAQLSGLRRGDRITAVNGIKLTSDNIANIEKGSGGSFQISSYHAVPGQTEKNGNPQYVWEIKDTINMIAANKQTYDPVYFDSIYNISGKRIGYIMLNKANLQENTDNYINRLAEVIANLKSCDDIIIDIRYNSESNIRYITELASMLYESNNDEDVFLTKRYNKNNSDKDSTIFFTGNYPGSNLGKSELYFITGENTAMEAEAMLRRLSKSMDIVVTGSSSAGKNIIQQPFTNPEYTQYVIYPVVAYYSADNIDTNDFTPIEVSTTANEREKTIESFKQIGDTAEIMLKATINRILNPEQPETVQ